MNLMVDRAFGRRTGDLARRPRVL